MISLESVRFCFITYLFILFLVNANLRYILQFQVISTFNSFNLHVFQCSTVSVAQYYSVFSVAHCNILNEDVLDWHFGQTVEIDCTSYSLSYYLADINILESRSFFCYGRELI